MAGTISVFHRLPLSRSGMILVPFGMFFNKRIAGARPGRAVTVRDGWRNERMRIAGICRIGVKTPVFAFMLRAIYGEKMTIAEITEKWREQSVVGGFGRHGFDEDECLLIELEGDGKEASNG